jgi:hypothetical protein
MQDRLIAAINWNLAKYGKKAIGWKIKKDYTTRQKGVI